MSILLSVLIVLGSMGVAPQIVSAAEPVENECSTPVVVAEAAPRAEYLETTNWIDSGGKNLATVVTLSRQTPACLVSRSYTKTAAAAFGVISMEILLREGRMEESLLDDSSGWEFQLIQQGPPRIESENLVDYREIIARVEELEAKGDPIASEASASASGVPSWSKEWSMTPAEMEQAGPDLLFESLDEAGFGRRMILAAPVSARSLIRELVPTLCGGAEMSSLCSIGDVFSFAGRFLDRYLPEGSELGSPADTAPSQVARANELETRYEISFTEDDLHFLEQFDSFDPLHPFAGTCAEEPSEEEPAEPR